MKSIRLLTLTLVLGLSLSGCNKSDPTTSTNLFGASPTIGEFNISKTIPQPLFQGDACTIRDEDFCFINGLVSVVERKVAMDRVTVTARVSDATGPGDILVAVVRFFDPPREFNATETRQISLELFDDGSVPVKTFPAGSLLIPVVSGDAVKGDGIFTRVFYFATDFTVGVGTCKEEIDFGNLGFTYSTYQTSVRDAPGGSGIPFVFNGEVIDKVGNIAMTGSVTFEIDGTFAEETNGFVDECP